MLLSLLFPVVVYYEYYDGTNRDIGASMVWHRLHSIVPLVTLNTCECCTLDYYGYSFIETIFRQQINVIIFYVIISVLK